MTGYAVSKNGPKERIASDPVSLELVVTKILESGIRHGSIVVKQSEEVTSLSIVLKVDW